jgi:puromycin-sensitive aminopeptidase
MTDYRLPKYFIPKNYAIVLDASLARSTFIGQLTLQGKIAMPTNTLELHAKDVTLQSVKAKVGNKRVTTSKIKYHKDRETVEITFKAPLAKGLITLEIAYKGKVSGSLHGLYLAKDGAEKALVSQCEAPFARSIFPCLDEPEFKATLQWTVKTDPDCTVITNGILESSKKKSGKVVHTFKRTRVIPTYLAALTIGQYEGSKAIKVNGIPCRTWAGPGKIGLTGFAQEVTQFVLPWYENYFGQKYNYQKLDQVAVPGFDAGAMENVGAIFYRQSLLLMQPGQTSWNAQKRIAEVIAHEIAHQWFGNLVTMKWWDDLWLNEAFATWIAYKVVDIWKPDWRLWDDYLESKEGALAADALVNTHPIYAEVKSPAEATELFDVITYEKGCAVLRMAEGYLGEKTFREGMRRYQRAFKNSNATGNDLWTQLAEASSQPIDILMQSWVSQSGFPLVTVELQAGNKLVLSQKRYFAHPDEIKKTNTQVWHIPLVIRYGAKDKVYEQRVLMDQPSMQVTLKHQATWVFANANSTGFYRQQISDAALKTLLDIGLPYLTPAERKTLIEDEWALTRCGRANIVRFMNVLTAFRGEKDHIVVRTLEARLGGIEHRLVNDGDRELLRQYIRFLFAPQKQELGFERIANEPPQKAVRRASMLRVLGDLGRDPAVLKAADTLRDCELADPASVDANIAGSAISLAALNGKEKLLKLYVDTYLARKKAKAAPDLQGRYLGALVAFEDPNVVSEVLALCLTDTIPQEQLRTLLGPMLANRESQQAAWEFLKKNWKTLAPRVGSMGISRLIEATGALPFELRRDVVDFFTKNPVEEAKRALQKALEAMDLRHDLVRREAGALGQWLRDNSASLNFKATA